MRVIILFTTLVLCTAAVFGRADAPGNNPRASANIEQAPPPRMLYPPTDASTLSLKLRINGHFGYEAIHNYYHEGKFELYMGDSSGDVREIHELLAPSNQLMQITYLSYVVLFENGLTVEVEARSRGLRGWGSRANGWRPITIPAGGSIVDKGTIKNEIAHCGDFIYQFAIMKQNKFAVAALIRPLGLASEYAGVNDFIPPKDVDPIVDANAYHVRKKLELEMKKRRSEERERMMWLRGLPIK